MHEEIGEPLGVFEEFMSRGIQKKTLHILTCKAWKERIQVTKDLTAFCPSEITESRNKNMTEEDRGKGDQVIHFAATELVEGKYAHG